MRTAPMFYKDTVCINVLGGSKQNAADIYEAAEGNIVVGLLSSNYQSVDAAVDDMYEYAQRIDNAISLGLGAGNPKQSDMVTTIAKSLQPQHVNQGFTGVAATRAYLNQNNTFINGMIGPTGTPGLVKISTGPLSSAGEDAIIPIETAILMIKDMGGNSVKFFPMHGLERLEEYRAIAQACAKLDFGIEPTGGIDLNNYEAILTIAIEAGVSKIIPHIYSSIIDAASGETRPKDVSILLDITKKALA